MLRSGIRGSTYLNWSPGRPSSSTTGSRENPGSGRFIAHFINAPTSMLESEGGSFGTSKSKLSFCMRAPPLKRSRVVVAGGRRRRAYTIQADSGGYCQGGAANQRQNGRLASESSSTTTGLLALTRARATNARAVLRSPFLLGLSMAIRRYPTGKASPPASAGTSRSSVTVRESTGQMSMRTQAPGVCCGAYPPRPLGLRPRGPSSIFRRALAGTRVGYT